MSRLIVHHSSANTNSENASDGFGATMTAGPLAKHDSAGGGHRLRQTKPILAEAASALIMD